MSEENVIEILLDIDLTSDEALAYLFLLRTGLIPLGYSTQFARALANETRRKSDDHYEVDNHII